MDPVVMIALEVGTTKERLVGKYSGGALSVELEKPAQFGKLSDLLKQYDVPVDSWPSFLREALALEAWLHALEYRVLTVGTTSSTTLGASSFTVASGITFPTELEGAQLVLDATDADNKKYTVTKNGTTLKYSATKANDQYTVEANVYKFLIQGAYENAITIIKNVLALKSIAFGITNDPTVDTAAFEKACRKVLDATHGTNTLPAAST
jgi:hypothetical protein